jgi:LysR family transcriptional activator of mexEF-oprN operon
VSELRIGAMLLSFKSFKFMINIIENDFRGVDLNLLLVFHALLQERNVTRAAQRLFIGQPALSGALKRLRAVFNDQLFVRTSHGMQPTARALELARAIDPLLLGLHQVMQQKTTFDFSTAKRVFHVGLSDALEVALMPALMQRIASIAPGIQLITHPADSRRASDMLDAGEIELAIGVFPPPSSWQRREVLFDWTFVCVYNPTLVSVQKKKISLAQYLAHPHVLTSFNSELHGYIDEQLERLGHSRHVIFSSRNFATSPLIVQQMPAITTVPTFAANAWRDCLGLAVSPLPFDVPSHLVSLLWATVNDGDSGLAWLRGVFADAFGDKDT